MLGQPPTVSEDLPQLDQEPDVKIVNAIDVDTTNSDDPFDFVVKTVERACGEPLGGDDLIDFVLDEKLDEKDSLLMDGMVRDHHRFFAYSYVLCSA